MKGKKMREKLLCLRNQQAGHDGVLVTDLTNLLQNFSFFVTHLTPVQFKSRFCIFFLPSRPFFLQLPVSLTASPSCVFAQMLLQFSTKITSSSPPVTPTSFLSAVCFPVHSPQNTLAISLICVVYCFSPLS